MRKADFIINIALVPIDFCLVLGAALTAYYFRFSPGIAQIRPIIFALPLSVFLPIVLKVALLSSLVFALSNFYTMTSKNLTQEFLRIINGVSTALLLLILGIFFQRELFSSRFIIIFAWATTIIYLFLARVIIFQAKNLFYRHGKGLANIILLGGDADSDLMYQTFADGNKWGYKVVYRYPDLGSLKTHPASLAAIADRQVDMIFQADTSLSKDDAIDLLTFCQENHLNLRYVANLFQTQSLNIDLTNVAGLPIVEIKPTPLDGWRKVFKRLFDLLGSILLIIVLSPLLISLALATKLSSPGPMLVSLTRVGQKGKRFNMYKFRSMIADAHKYKKDIYQLNERKDGPLFKITNDPRVTKFGRWLRRTSFDELPQLINVIKGEMSLVGPRPHEPEEVSNYERGYKKLMAIKPGITGLAQVSGRSVLTFQEEAKLDIFYIERWSILLDLIILIKTPAAMFKKGQAI